MLLRVQSLEPVMIATALVRPVKLLSCILIILQSVNQLVFCLKSFQSAFSLKTTSFYAENILTLSPT